MKSARFGRPGERIGQGLAHRVGSARRRERHAGVLGEERERAGLRLGELAVAHRGDHEAPDDGAVAVDGRRHGRAYAVGGEHLDLALAAAVRVRDQQSLLDDRPAADALRDRAAAQDARGVLVDAGARGEHDVGRVVLVDQAQPDDLAPEHLGRGVHDGVEDLVESRSLRDRALDDRELLHQLPQGVLGLPSAS